MAKSAAWKFYPALASFDGFADSWGKLNHSLLQNHPLGDKAFVGPLIRYFADSRDFIAVQPGSFDYRGMLLLRMDKFGVVRSFRPSQTEICPILVHSLEDVQALFAALPSTKLALQLHCQDPDYGIFPSALSSLLVEVDQHAVTVAIDLRDDFNTYWSNRPAKLKQNIARVQRNLKQNGVRWRFETVESPEEVRDAVDRYGDLESRGWKFQAGTAVNSANAQGQFYRDILGGFAEKGKGVVYELYFEDFLVSSQLAIGNDELIITLKTTYDEEFSKYSPGKLLDYLTLRHEFELGRFSKVEFCTNATRELIWWGTQGRSVCHITVYRNQLAWRLVGFYRNLKSIAIRGSRNRFPSKNSMRVEQS